MSEFLFSLRQQVRVKEGEPQFGYRLSLELIGQIGAVMYRSKAALSSSTPLDINDYVVQIDGTNHVLQESWLEEA